MTGRQSSWHEDRCTYCGLCFHLCPVLEMPLVEAQEEIRRLCVSGEGSVVLKKCNSCMSCNLFCPEGANPYNLVLERWNELYQKRGAPPLYRFVCPTEEPNIWQLINLFLSPEERRWIDAWMDCTPGEKDTVLLIGNYTHLFPFIIGGSSLLEHFKPVDRIDQWEGGAYLYQGGYLDVVQRIARRTRDDFARWNVKDIVILTDAVHYLLTEVHPREMGISHEARCIPFHRWAAEKIEKGELALPAAPLGISVAVHDNCYSKVLGGAYWDDPRYILEKCGCNVIEMKHSRADALCCGFGAGASWVRNMSIPFDIIWEGVKKFREAEETGAGAMVSYCSGCIYLLWATRELMGSSIDVYHSVELLRMAMGEKIPYPQAHIERAWDVIAIITYQLLRSLFQRNFFISSITYDTKRSTFIPRGRGLLGLIRRVLGIPLVRKVYAGIFRTLMPYITTR